MQFFSSSFWQGKVILSCVCILMYPTILYLIIYEQYEYPHEYQNKEYPHNKECGIYQEPVPLGTLTMEYGHREIGTESG